MNKFTEYNGNQITHCQGRGLINIKKGLKFTQCLCINTQHTYECMNFVYRQHIYIFIYR